MYGKAPNMGAWFRAFRNLKILKLRHQTFERGQIQPRKLGIC